MSVERLLVTGASRGIGRAVAEALLAGGRRVALSARNEARLAEVAARGEGRAAVLARDLLDDPSGLVAEARDALGGLDGLVHAAGIADYTAAPDVPVEELERAYRLHVRAPMVLTQELARALRAEGRPGAVVHIGSTLALRNAPMTSAYAASKAALHRLAQAHALELAADRIRVNVVAPGVVETDMVRALRLGPGEVAPTGAEREARVAAQLEALRRLHPLGRLGRPADVAGAVLYLLDAEWVTGTVLVVDGGVTAT